MAFNRRRTLVASCSKPPPLIYEDDGLNARRASLGLRQIPSTWVVYRKAFGATDWKSDAAGPQIKRVQREEDSQQLLWEEDYYPTERIYVTHRGPDGTESVTIHYNYVTGMWHLHYIGTDPGLLSLVSPRYKTGVTDPKDLHRDADLLLSRIGLKRL